MEEEIMMLPVDSGSSMNKACFAGDNTPRNVFLAIVGSPQCQNIMVVLSQNDFYMGNGTKSKQDSLTLMYPHWTQCCQ